MLLFKIVLLLAMIDNTSRVLGSESDVCGSVIENPQVIAINFGLDFIAAVQAHSATNFSLLAALTPDDPIGNYQMHLYSLRKAYIQRNRANDRNEKMKQMRPSWPFELLADFSAHMSHYSYTIAQTSRSPMIRSLANQLQLIWQNISLTIYKSNIYIHSLWARCIYCWLVKTDKTSTRQTIQREIANAFTLLNQKTWENSQVNITEALVIVPTFMRQIELNMENLFRRALKDSNVTVTLLTNPQQVTTMWGLNWIRSMLQERREEPFIMTIEWGWHYLDLDTFTNCLENKGPGRLDWMGASSIFRKLTDKVLASNEHLRAQIQQGASLENLSAAVYKARYLIKGEQLFHTGEDNANEIDERSHYDEWPLDISGWSMGAEQGAVLRWEDVQAVEDQFVQDFVEILEDALLCRDDSDDFIAGPASGNVGKVLFLGMSVHDTALLRRAVRQTMGDQIVIIEDDKYGLAVENGARAAWIDYKVKEGWKRLQCESEQASHHEL